MKSFAAVIAVALPGGAVAQSTPPEDPSLIAYLQQRAGEAADTTRYTAALTPDGKTALVYLTGPAWCGSGGCRLLAGKGLCRRVTGGLKFLSETFVISY
jgi:hypothetical protein